MKKLLLMSLIGCFQLASASPTKPMISYSNANMNKAYTDSIIGDSLYKLAERLFYQNKNYKQAFDTFIEAAINGKPLGLTFIGCEALTDNNLFENVSKIRGRTYLREAAAEDETGAMLCLVDYYYSVNQLDSTLHFLNAAALLDNDLANYYLGHLYLKGQLPGCEDDKRHRVLPDPKKGFEYLQKSNHPNAQYQLGLMYMKGTMEIQSNQEKALQYFQKCLKNNALTDKALREKVEKNISRLTN